MKKRMIRPVRLLLTLALLAAVLLGVFPAQVSADTDSDIKIQEGVTLHCWNWSYKFIEQKMDIIASLGYTAIQTSPIQQAKQPTDGYPSNDWWVYYQPMAFHIDNTATSALGTKAEFKSMCEAAHKHGIKVIVDIVANHMGNKEGNDLAATIHPDLKKDPECWHDISKNINNYNSRFEVTQYCMAGLPDLNTANKKVQDHVLKLLKACIDAGADGFRFDAVKHIETPEDGSFASDFWPTVVNGAKDYAMSTRGLDLYCYGELLDSPGGSLPVSAYTKYMSITDNVWSNGVLSNVIGNKNAGSFSASYRKSADASQLVLWAESHDTFADGTTYKVSDENINKAWALVAARADAMGLYFARPANMSQILGTASNTGWSFPEVAAVNRFHNRFIGQSEYVANENGIAYVERGNSGVVLVNCKGGEAQVSITANAIADGTYTDQITGSSFIVSGGKISGTIGSTGIAVVSSGEVCAHDSHDSNGFCTACRVNVGHVYDENNTCACGDVKITSRTIYFTNSGKWSKVNFYSWYTDADIISSAWPGDPMTKVEGNIYACTVPANAPNIIFNDGSTQTEDLLVPAESSGLNMYDYATDKWSTYNDPTVTPPVDPTQPTETTPADPTQPTETDPTDPTQPTETKPTEPSDKETPAENANPILWICLGAAALVIVGVIIFVLKRKKS